MSDKEFNDSLKYTIQNINYSSLWVGSHNEKSCSILMKLMIENNLQNGDKRIWFSQLYGMSDNISFNLAKRNYNVFKILPFGSVKNLMPYLIRRAEENTSVSGQTGRELQLIQNERNRRLKLKA